MINFLEKKQRKYYLMNSPWTSLNKLWMSRIVLQQQLLLLLDKKTIREGASLGGCIVRSRIRRF
jgi:hypothetical protein